MASTKVLVINWSANEGDLISKLITELKKLENFKVFLGKKNKHDVSSDVPSPTQSHKPSQAKPRNKRKRPKPN